MRIAVGRALVTFMVAYVIVTILCYSLGYLGEAVLGFPPPVPGASIFDSPAFVTTVPYQLLANLLVWTAFGGIYLRGVRLAARGIMLREALSLGLFWLGVAMLVDFVGFVVIDSPLSLTARQFYIEYQPWITITYLIVAGSPLLYASLFKRRRVPAV